MVRLSRYILVLVTTLTLSAILPQLWWMALDKPIRKPFIMYSCIENDFLIRRIDGNTRWEDTRGNQYSREEYEELLPFLNVRDQGTYLPVHELTGLLLDLLQIRG